MFKATTSRQPAVVALRQHIEFKHELNFCHKMFLQYTFKLEAEIENTEGKLVMQKMHCSLTSVGRLRTKRLTRFFSLKEKLDMSLRRSEQLHGSSYKLVISAEMTPFHLPKSVSEAQSIAIL